MPSIQGVLPSEHQTIQSSIQVMHLLKFLVTTSIKDHFFTSPLLGSFSHIFLELFGINHLNMQVKQKSGKKLNLFLTISQLPQPHRSLQLNSHQNR